MKWLYELDNIPISLSEDQTKFYADIRSRNQVTLPAGILKMISKGVGIPNFQFPENSSVILQVKAIHINNNWYRLSTKVERNKRKVKKE